MQIRAPESFFIFLKPDNFFTLDASVCGGSRRGARLCDAYVEAFDAVFQRDADHLVVVFDLAGAVSFVTNNEGDLFRQFCEGFVVVDARRHRRR